MIDSDRNRSENRTSKKVKKYFKDKLPKINSNDKNERTIHDDDGDNMSTTSFHTAKSAGVSKEEQASVKIYLLLLELQTKKFELNQICIPSKSDLITLGDILDIIPSKASDVVLAQQLYRGLCRPLNGIEMTNLSSYVISDTSEYGIVPGEILIPIPEKYTGIECMYASKSILKLPVIENMFQQLDSMIVKKSTRDVTANYLNRVDEVASPSSSNSQFEYYTNNCLRDIDGPSTVKAIFSEKKKVINNKEHSPCKNYEEQFLRYQQKLKRSPLLSKIIASFIICYIFRKIVYSKISGTKSTFIVGCFEVFMFFYFLVWIQKKDEKKVKRKLVYGQ